METPKTLYKYVSAHRVLTCIPEVGDGTLRATQPAALNDPFECAVAITDSTLDEAEENRVLAEVLTEINTNRPFTEECVKRAREQHGSLFTRQLFAQQVSTKFGIVSFTSDPRHPLMWSHYTTDGSGFVIGYDSSMLSKLAKDQDSVREIFYYAGSPPKLAPIIFDPAHNNLPFLLSIKSRHWSYEQEWRVIIELDKTIGTGQTDPLGQPINLLRVPNEAVVSVYYTERTPAESVNLIRDRLSDPNNRYRAGNPIKLVMSATSYGYEEAPD